MKKPVPTLGQVPLTPAVFHVLLALADGPLHGYAIMQAVEASAGRELRMGPGTIYGSIQRMEEAGLVRELPGTRYARFARIASARLTRSTPRRRARWRRRGRAPRGARGPACGARSGRSAVWNGG